MPFNQWFKANPGPNNFFAMKRGTGFIQGTHVGYNIALKGNLPWAILGGGYEAMMAPAGHKISAGMAGATSFGATAFTAGLIGTMIGGPALGYAAAIVAPILLGNDIDKAMAGTFQAAVDFGANMRRLRFGGDYRDTQTAYTMRQTAARDMSGSLMNARQWLGQEGAFMHQ